MDRFKRILFYADPAAPLEPALQYAARAATHTQGVVTVVDYLEPAPLIVKALVPSTWDLQTVISNNRQARLDTIAGRLRDAGIQVAVKLLTGEPAVEIMREVHHGGHNVVMKTARGSSENKEKEMFGTTAIYLMRHCPCPVWVVDPGETDHFHRILVAIDPQTRDRAHTELNANVLELAADIAKWESGELHIVYAWEAYGEATLRSRVSREYLSQYIAEEREHVEKQTIELLSRFGFSAFWQNVKLLHGDPTEKIPDYVSQLDIDLVVIGTVGRTGVAGFVVGNTAENILRCVRCSVLAVKPDTVDFDLTFGKRKRSECEPTPYPHFAEPHSSSSQRFPKLAH